jgi:hypothetical protein
MSSSLPTLRWGIIGESLFTPLITEKVLLIDLCKPPA